ncbi:ROK family protein [Mucilaginibacter sp. BJC16-A38]|uniref:ROK family protein n=1 Tax=Mucilaginibacter phenanthrenivorans TaxID=1234842 RepID=UPI002157EBD6|nr:ROK family protein [Mucilaginibacter phenanthrenivorans]MCR8558973.1 ROK family protein [Mucilaginibacter phenanthrenivorans]
MELKTKSLKGGQLKNMIVKRLYFDKALSCADLSELLEKSIPSISKAVSELIDEGFVVEQGFAPSSGGRRPLIYALKQEAMYTLTVAMDQLSMRIQMVDLLNNPVSEEVMTELRLLNNPNALSALIENINDYIISTGIPKDKITGVGIGMPGFVDTVKGVNHTYLDSGGESITHLIAMKTGIPAYIDNDSSLIALAEQKFGIARAQRDVMVINLGWGIGLGMIVNGEIYRGNNGFAGEFSHIPLSEDGALCICGKRGCLEAEASMLVVAEKAIKGIKKGHVSSLKAADKYQARQVGDAIMAAANMGDQFAIELLSDAGYKIGKALAILIHIMNPASIVLSGRGAIIAKILLAPIQQALNKYCIPRLANGTELLISDLGFNAELTGAAVLVMGNFDKDTKNHLITSNQ